MTRTAEPLRTLAAHVDEMTEDGFRRRRAADLARITASVPEPAPVRRRRTAFVLAGVAGVAAAAVAAAVVAVPAVTSGHEKVAPPAPPLRALDAKSVLLASADISAKRPMTTHGNYWYSQLREVERARRPGKAHIGTSANGSPRNGPYFPFRAYVSITWENWDPYRQGQPSRMVDRDIRTSFATPADKAAWQRAGSPSLTDMKPFSADSRYNEPYLELGPKGTTMADLPKLPATPAGLEKLIRQDRKRSLAQLSRYHAERQELPFTEEVLNAAVGIITSPTTPKVRAAAYRMLAAQKGFRGVGMVRDALGRPGVALAVRVSERTLHGFQRSEERLIIDPGSAEILAKEFYPIGKDGKAASEPSRFTLMTGQGWTDRIGEPAQN
jgi:hypothetical protein